MILVNTFAHALLLASKLEIQSLNFVKFQTAGEGHRVIVRKSRLPQ